VNENIVNQHSRGTNCGRLDSRRVFVGLIMALSMLTSCFGDDGSRAAVFDKNIDLSTLSVDDGTRACRLFETRLSLSIEDTTSNLCYAINAIDVLNGKITDNTCESNVGDCRENQSKFVEFVEKREKKTDCEDRIVQRSFRGILLECPTGYTTEDLTVCLDQIADQADRAESALACTSSIYEIAAVFKPDTPGVCKTLIEDCPGVGDLINLYRGDTSSFVDPSSLEPSAGASVKADDNLATAPPQLSEESSTSPLEKDVVEPADLPVVAATTPDNPSPIVSGVVRLASDESEACWHIASALPWWISFDESEIDLESAQHERDRLICTLSTVFGYSKPVGELQFLDQAGCEAEVNDCISNMTDDIRDHYPLSPGRAFCADTSEESTGHFFQEIFQSCQEKINLHQLTTCLNEFSSHYQAVSCESMPAEGEAYEPFVFPSECTAVIQSCEGIQEVLELALMHPVPTDVVPETDGTAVEQAVGE